MKPGKPQLPKGWQEVLDMQARPTLVMHFTPSIIDSALSGILA